MCPHKKEPSDNKVIIHVSTSDGAIRIDKDAFRSWLLKNKLSIARVERELRVECGATTTRLTLGAGTRFSQSRAWVIEVPIRTLARGVSSKSGGSSVNSVAQPEYSIASGT